MKNYLRKMLDTHKTLLEERRIWMKSIDKKATLDLSAPDKVTFKDSIDYEKPEKNGEFTDVKEILNDLNETNKLSKEQIIIHKQTLKSTIQDLNNQNQNLKIRLEKLQSSNNKGNCLCQWNKKI